jgi:hypothetical protein
MQREIDVVNSGVAGGGGVGGGHTVPMLRTLNRDIDLQHMPLTTVQQLHATIQHDLEFVEQVRSCGL